MKHGTQSDTEALIQEGPTHLRRPLAWFARYMEEKLRENDHKGHWAGCTVGYLTQRIHEELRELMVVLHGANFCELSPEEALHVVTEAADVANFAMMIADNARTYLVDAETRSRIEQARST